MQALGGLLVFLGAGSFVLKYVDMQFVLLSWTDNWGPDVGLGIRISMIVVGAVLWLLGRKSAARSAPSA